MENNDLSSILVAHGFTPKSASSISKKIDGTDLVNLISAFNSNTQEGFNTAEQILQGYGYNIEDNTMTERKSYLNALFKSVQTGGKLHTMEELQDLSFSEDGNIEDQSLAQDGFNYYTVIDDSKKADELMDWLDDNGIDYLISDAGKFHIKCSDRSVAYHVSREISRINRTKNIVRDSVAEASKSVRQKIKPRDPNASVLHKLQAKNPEDLEDKIAVRKKVQQDSFSRKAKHKNNFTESRDLVLEEGVMSMTKMGSIGRLRELAGLPPAKLPQEVANEDDFSDISFDDTTDDTLPSDPMDDLPQEPSIAVIPSDDTIDNGVPGDLPPADAELASVPLNVSPAMSVIQDAINNIGTSLPDLKVSEYKQVINQLTNLLSNTRDTGRNYLGEHSGYKKKAGETGKTSSTAPRVK